MTSLFGPHDRFKSKVTSCNNAWNIYLDTKNAKLIVFIPTYFLFIYLLIYLIIIVILLSVVIILYQGIFFVHHYMRSS